jgi:UDP-N-acetylglucosamine diphosphorylase / glucose-1-phosphate thymidylyltransferase / UDP-N-acetylgalactosamine diphosphorylase / glucosamine-1-phosphate N-acetyltransferase / galactosamine-1-phosphate N-acetyltransferase
VKIIFDDSAVKESLWPFTATRNAADIRVGILTVREKWELIFQKLNLTAPVEFTTDKANFIPTLNYIDLQGHLVDDRIPVVWGLDDIKILKHPSDIFKFNEWAIRKDYRLITDGKKSQSISSTNQIISPENIFVEEGATVECSTINASAGPVYIGKNATVMEGCLIRGPFALCEGATLKMGAKVYGATTIGPYCIAGGEIKNSILFGYSNKAHDGYLGDSVIGEWCNFGAGTTNSNIKNTAGEVKMWNEASKEFTGVGIKAGLIMGDYSRAAINTSFNTGTVIGVCCNIFSEGFPPKLINNFTWGDERYEFEKAIQDIDNWKKLKGKSITEEEKEILKQLYNQSN